MNKLGFIFVLLAFFLAGFFISKKNGQKINGDIEIDEILRATNSASFKITVASYIFDDLEFFINDKSVKKIRVEPSDFITELSGLKLGKNEVYILAKDSKTGSKMKSEEEYITYETTKPKLIISSPKDKETVYGDTVEIKGKTDPDSFVLINDQPVDYYKDGNFGTELKLDYGENKIKIFSQDLAGNHIRKTLTIIYMYTTLL
ncbi:hypothetical protein A2767_04065 [Candidatus Roizmanbacteria bacterium RIFCSPHIGHO2_01_FULL_35_10]|uniref:Uncharacterized protein n=1 Tax=Candidatus Roizmanbacteria bacterium RIFCSPLOWO2_01_FULL_35_13 TaxID=1802055 RepID=A0A1F7IH33_9BACT|nr:MAG: hypothetical protein A2767_04065 [Candidatus Roizmanbacteria bacterium RIFCSPHIGHO2_01_FULL_35_10]OGK42684.1 MAG: hypothetical protein A3A74_00050 [Candidatus Roizmanbacteria bacterium RIFCSPLOWO2_01_FULL_35_13]